MQPFSLLFFKRENFLQDTVPFNFLSFMLPFCHAHRTSCTARFQELDLIPSFAVNQQ
ncbi:hypothetical protein MANES_10G010250v8 [Manihot esculenta]|uniref:Uncharacterized protein n=1 Tax=Manihot esculenta TaxID=3983 RepID=A0ACB7GY03_MANES|nr:hypothetical protein MANES_10G010250v8 [Manihot esculenta]